MPDGIIPEVSVVIHETTREAWISRLIDIWRPFFDRLGYPLPAKIYASTSDLRPSLLGRCYPQARSDDGNPHIFVSSVIGDPYRVGEIVYHELCHAALDCEGGHGAEFKKLATMGGLVGKMKATMGGPMFIDFMQGVIERIGPYPHAPLRQKKSTKGTNTRQLRVQCPQCGALLRMTKMWLDVWIPPCGNPGCHARGEPMTVQWRTKPDETAHPFKPDFET